MSSAALGIVPRTGRATVVAVAGGAVVLRREVRASATTEDGQLYHRAAEGPAARAAALIERGERALVERATGELRALIDELAAGGAVVRAAAVVRARAVRDLPALDAILRAHPLLHAAEGALFHGVFAAAARACGLRVIAMIATDLGEPAIARPAGPPWGALERQAAAAALAIRWGYAPGS